MYIVPTRIKTEWITKIYTIITNHTNPLNYILRFVLEIRYISIHMRRKIDILDFNTQFTKMIDVWERNGLTSSTFRDDNGGDDDDDLPRQILQIDTY
jgi:hypothetical protein